MGTKSACAASLMLACLAIAPPARPERSGARSCPGRDTIANWTIGFWINGAAGDANAQARAVRRLGFDGEVASDETEALLHAD